MDIKYLIEICREYFDHTLTPIGISNYTTGKKREKSRTRIECHERGAMAVREKGEGHVLDFHPARL